MHVQAKAALRAGMETLSQAEVGSALQIYFNLNELPQVSALHHLSSFLASLSDDQQSASSSGL